MPTQKKSGFTLIELLVVIAIIAILAAILFPVFARAREQARKTNCASNLKNCAIALQTYWTDYDATLPSSANAGGPSNFEDFGGKMGIVPMPSSWTGSTGLAKTWVQMLYPHMKNKDIIFCPSDTAEHYASGNTNEPRDTPKISYFWKYAIDQAWHGIGTINGDKCQKEGDFGYNADQIVLYERSGFHTGESNLKEATKINVVYLDTHVRNVSMTNLSGQTSGNASPGGNTGEPFYFNFDQEQPKEAGKNPKVANWTDPRNYSDLLP